MRKRRLAWLILVVPVILVGMALHQMVRYHMNERLAWKTAPVRDVKLLDAQSEYTVYELIGADSILVMRDGYTAHTRRLQQITKVKLRRDEFHRELDARFFDGSGRHVLTADWELLVMSTRPLRL